MYRPTTPFTQSVKLLIPTIEKVKGREEEVYDYDSGITINCNFKTYGGTAKDDTEKNGLMTILDTAEVETWYDSRIKSHCKIAFSETDMYDILGEPEDIEKRHQFMKFKVQKING